MTNTEQRFEPYQTQVLFLLIGSNPLPNYIAAQILTRSEAEVYLLHSAKTTKVADRIARRLANVRNDLNVMLFGIDEADGPSISRKVIEIMDESVKRIRPQSIGLNFTGGTKPMAAYAAMGIRLNHPKSILSYLDAHSLGMVIDQGEGFSITIPIGRTVNCSLEEILDLHGYRIRFVKGKSQSLMIAKALAEIHMDRDKMGKWRDWVCQLSTRMHTPSLSDYPELKPVLGSFTIETSSAINEENLANAVGYSTITQCINYFSGTWLEDYTWNAIDQIADQVGLQEYYMSITVQARGRPDYEIDVVAVLGYQVFGISCIVTENKNRAKEHLMEIYTRAGQFGGDEARFAVVTYYDRPDILEKEICEEWDAQGKIRVFGRNHIQDLSSHLLQWFRDANQEAL